MLGMFWLAYSGFRLLSGWFFTRFFTHWSPFWNPDFPFPFFLHGMLRGVGMMLMATGIFRRAASSAEAGPGRSLASSSSNSTRKLVSNSSMISVLFAEAQRLCH